MSCTWQMPRQGAGNITDTPRVLWPVNIISCDLEQFSFEYRIILWMTDPWECNSRSSAIAYLSAAFVLESIFDIDVNCKEVTDKRGANDWTAYDLVGRSCDYDLMQLDVTTASSPYLLSGARRT